MTAIPERLTIYTVYDHPADYPNNFVVRKFFVEPGGIIIRDAEVKLHHDIEVVRKEMIKLGCTYLSKMPGDSDNIVETWIE